MTHRSMTPTPLPNNYGHGKRLVYGALLVLALAAIPLLNALPAYAAATWTDITPTNDDPWTSVGFLGEVDDIYYVTMRYNDGGNRYVLYEMDNSTLTQNSPTGDWTSFSAPVQVDSKLYFMLGNTVFGTGGFHRKVYELDSGVWSDETPTTPTNPTGAWDQGGAGVAFEGNGYFALRDDAEQEYRLLELSNGAWDDITPVSANDWTHASILGEAGGKLYVTMRYNDGGNRYVLYEMTGGVLTEVTPTGTWQSITMPGVELDGKHYFVFRDASTFTQRIYELDNGTFTNVTPAGTWDQGGAGIAFEGNGYFSLQSESDGEYHLWEYSNGAWDDITPSGADPWTLASFVGQVGDNYYVSMRYSDGGNRYLLYEMTGGNLTEITPTGEWASLSGSIDLGGVGYFTFANATLIRHIYELDGGSWTDVTPTGTWDQGGNGPVFENKGYYSLQDQTESDYHLWELDPPSGSLTIVLDASPEDDTGFTFSGDAEIGAFSLQDPSDNTRVFDNVFTGTYTVTQTVPAGWTLIDASCTGGDFTSLSNGVSVTVGEDEDITCTFTNEEEQSGNLSIVLDASPADDTSFDFSGDSGLGSFSLSDPSNNTESFVDLDVGTYTITETVPAGWSLNNSTCVGGNYSTTTDGVVVTVTDGDDITCTFTNVADPVDEEVGDLTIVLDASPKDNTPFEFSGDAGLGDFTLSDPSDATEVFTDLSVGVYTVAQTIPAGWSLTDTSCTGSAYVAVKDGVEVTIADGDDVVCTFANVADPVGEDTGNLTIVLDAPPADDTIFDFSVSSGLGSFSLSDPSNRTETFANIPFGDYSVTQTVPPDWVLSSVTCTGGVYNAVSNGVDVTVGDGESVTCTFTNRRAWWQYLPIFYGGG